MTSARYRPGLTLPSPSAGDIFWFAFRGPDLLVRLAESPAGHAFTVPLVEDLTALGLIPVRTQPLGQLDGRACCSAELRPDAAVPEHHAYVSLRRLHGRIEQVLFDVAATAFQIQYWDRAHQYCAACGSPVELKTGERAKWCARCESDYFPRVTPAIIVLVEDGSRILMTRQARFPPGIYGLVAGFVDPGESLEACVVREVREETNVEIADITYFGSQPWPFPHQIMIGFTARYAGGTLIPDTRELEDARWFERDALPLLPPPISIARKLVDAWLARDSAWF